MMAHDSVIKKDVMVKAQQRWFYVRHTSAVIPAFNFKNKLERIKFIISNIKQNSRMNEYVFYDMKNMVHIDEKWFNIYKENSKYYLLPY